MRSRLLLGLLLLATPLLVGSKCVVIFSSGGSDQPPKDPNEPRAEVRQGSLAGLPVQGLAYRAGAYSGLTGVHGEFRYQDGASVIFSIGDIRLGPGTPARAGVTTADLVGEDSVDSPAALNLVRLLMALDATPGDDTITIPDSVRREAVATNPDLFWAVPALDFSDEQGFTTVASALVAVLTRDYPFTATLADGDTARRYLREAMKAGTGPAQPAASPSLQGPSTVITADSGRSAEEEPTSTR